MPLPKNADTIAAIATPSGRGGIGIVRISGSGSLEHFITKVLRQSTLAPRHAAFGPFFDASGEIIDEGIALFFPAPNSFTGENILELHGHGGPVIMQLLLQRCLDLGARLAEPGEFTQRAFLNDKFDLAQAESVADLIDASTAEAARSAVRSLQGEFSAAVHELVAAVTRLRMLVEATLDFPEEDIDFLQAADAMGQLATIRVQLDQLFVSARQGSLLREGLHVVLVGQPNVGKSSLLNRLAGDEVAIVTAIPGTTRDAIRTAIQIRGIPLHIVDTAGLRDTSDAIEQIGIARTWAAVEQADIILLLLDSRQGMAAADTEILARLPKVPQLQVFNKIDLLQAPPAITRDNNGAEVYLSAKTGQGIDLLREEILRLAGWQDHPGSGAFMARERHLRALTQAQLHLQTADHRQRQIEIFAEELKCAQNALSTITGEFSADDLLGEIFSRFCIGK